MAASTAASTLRGISHGAREPDGARTVRRHVDLVAAVIWIALAFWPARVAGRKGHSFFGFFLLSLLFFPLALILA